jgi:hypothetical protein
MLPEDALILVVLYPTLLCCNQISLPFVHYICYVYMYICDSI